ncbi:hypothetical protein DIPPA_30983 [Diplonema papillatum]|nr:hypothetical protein DIPPA_30983 [Diplonema papillatum]
MFGLPGMGPPVEVTENQWAALPFYSKVNHFVCHGLEVLDRNSSRWVYALMAMLILHKDADPSGSWMASRIRLFIGILQASIPVPQAFMS